MVMDGYEAKTGQVNNNGTESVRTINKVARLAAKTPVLSF